MPTLQEQPAATRAATPALERDAPVHAAAAPTAPVLTALLGHGAFQGRGNGPVHQATVQALQRTAGNRATVRYLQRQSAVPVQRCGGATHAGCGCAAGMEEGGPAGAAAATPEPELPA